jgi:hypothetical protein
VLPYTYYMADGRLIVWRAFLCLKPRRKTVLNPDVAEDERCERMGSRRLRGAEAGPQFVEPPPLVVGHSLTLQLFPELSLHLAPLFGAHFGVTVGELEE